MSTVARAVGLFAATNVDDIVLLALFFAQRGSVARVVIGQYAGFAAILAVAVLAALGATLLPGSAVRWLGVIPIVLGVKAWFDRDDEDAPVPAGVLGVTAVTFANGGDNVGVYVPVFAQGDIALYSLVFLVLVAPLCWAGWFAATRPVVARVLARVGHIVFPVVLIGIGVAVLIYPSD